MFRKIVSNLSFSPALVGQLGFYAKRLRQEEATRRLGLIFTALALVFQSFAVFQPPESANAASSNDILYGGITSKTQLMDRYDKNTQNFRDLLNAIGITRTELASSNMTSINSKNIPASFGRLPHFSYAKGERPYTFPVASGSNITVYYRPLSNWDTKTYTIKNGSTYQAFGGKSAAIGSFWIMLDCGNVALTKPPRVPPCPTGTTGTYPNCATPKCPVGQTGTYPKCVTPPPPPTPTPNKKCAPGQTGTYPNCVTPSTPKCPTGTTGTYPNCKKPCLVNPSLDSDSPECVVCAGAPTLWAKDEKCKSNLVQSKTAINITQGGVDASKVTAKPSDQITYTVTVKNTGLADTSANVDEHLQDVLEYAKILDNGGGTLNDETNVMSWSNVPIKAGQQVSRVFSVKVNDTISAMPTGKSNRSSYDCTITNTFGNTIDVKVECPTEKVVVEQITSELPQTGPTENIIFAGVLMTIVTYFYARSRQLKTEVRLIRRDFNMGTI